VLRVPKAVSLLPSHLHLTLPPRPALARPPRSRPHRLAPNAGDALPRHAPLRAVLPRAPRVCAERAQGGGHPAPSLPSRAARTRPRRRATHAQCARSSPRDVQIELLDSLRSGELQNRALASDLLCRPAPALGRSRDRTLPRAEPPTSFTAGVQASARLAAPAWSDGQRLER
jgi:hypothetical protein